MDYRGLTELQMKILQNAGYYKNNFRWAKKWEKGFYICLKDHPTVRNQQMYKARKTKRTILIGKSI
jgi:hypothetical protein